jgi:hypothetical protein
MDLGVGVGGHVGESNGLDSAGSEWIQRQSFVNTVMNIWAVLKAASFFTS